ncbi:hypothetical protein COLO4_05691 [Corchorus olitorius]|uniref:Uncharacterized protein n=1 Tax=Corchorus olitorius TaxID=93759 RepID=A0A1R3KQA1_9ROSI|nr:hypothetical protein COLO4_05691 [Corchorus olitorius]
MAVFEQGFAPSRQQVSFDYSARVETLLPQVKLAATDMG